MLHIRLQTLVVTGYWYRSLATGTNKPLVCCHGCCPTNVPIPYGDFRKHINSFLKRKWQSQWDETANNKLHEIHPQLGLWPGGSRIIRRWECFGKISNWSHSFDSLLPFERGRSSPMYSV